MSPDDQESTPLEREMHVIACRLREKYDLDSVVIMGCKQENNEDRYETDTAYALSGNHYAAKHMAARYAVP